MTSTSILILIIVLMLIGSVVYRYRRLSFVKRDVLRVLGLACVAFMLSFFVSTTRVGGTIESSYYGWPHFVLQHQNKDILDDFRIDIWSFAHTTYLYGAANLLFYLSASFALIAFIKKDQK